MAHALFASSPRKFYPWHLLLPRCEAVHARTSMHRFVCHARVLVHTPSLEGPLLIGFTAFIYVVTRSRKTSPFFLLSLLSLFFSLSLGSPFFSRFLPSFLPLGFYLFIVSSSSCSLPRARFTKGFQPFEGSNTSPRTVLNVKLWITGIYTRPVHSLLSSTCYPMVKEKIFGGKYEAASGTTAAPLPPAPISV